MTPQPLDFISKTDKGRVRDANEDCYGHFETAEYADLGGQLFVVADGVGGAEFGEVASRQTVDTLADAYYKQMQARPDLTIEDALLNAIVEANTQVYQEATRRQVPGQMGSTVVAAVIHEQRLFVAWAGDSRAYLANPQEDRIRQLTDDHTTAEEYRRIGKPLPRDAVPDALSRGIGVSPEIIPECIAGNLAPDDVVLLCSDGLYNYFNSEELRQALLAPQLLDQMADDLIETAKSRGGADNITLIALAVGEQTWRQTAPQATPQLSGSSLLQPTQNNRRSSRSVPALGFASVLVIGLLLGFLLGGSHGSPSEPEAAAFASLPTVTPIPTQIPSPTRIMSPTETPLRATLSPPPLPPAVQVVRPIATADCGGQTREDLCSSWTTGMRTYLLQDSPIYLGAAGSASHEYSYALHDAFTIVTGFNTTKACFIVNEECWWYVEAKNGITGWMPQNILTTELPVGAPLQPTSTHTPLFGDAPQNDVIPTPTSSESDVVHSEDHEQSQTIAPSSMPVEENQATTPQE